MSLRPQRAAFPLIAAFFAAGLLNLPVTAREAPPVPDSESAVLFGEHSRLDDGRTREVSIVRVNDLEHFVAYRTTAPKLWRAGAGAARVKLSCYEYKKHKFTGYTVVQEFRLFSFEVLAGHYYELTCIDMLPAARDRGTDASAIPELSDLTTQR